MNKIILGIESSCDDTAVALVNSEGEILSSVISSQLTIHNQFGGVYPEFAARAHIKSILPTVHEALKRANLTKDDISAIAITRGPGLIGSLLVGINTAKALAIGWNKPIIGINHLRGHLRSADLEEKRIIFPSTILLVSGGHSFLAYMTSETDIKLLGSTLDDSAGECYDKVARMLGLGYPGGPLIDKLAKEGNANIKFPRPVIDKGLYFSFSGLKSAVARYIEANKDYNKADVAASFVEAVIDVLITKSNKALKMYPSKSFVMVGGVSASPQIREAVIAMCNKRNVKASLPPLKWSTDNAAMIALAAFDYLNAGIEKPPVSTLNLTIEDF